MEYSVPFICGLLLILGLVAVVMSRKVWNVGQMILVAFVLIGSLVYFYMAARTLKMRQNWAENRKEFQQKIADTEHGKVQGGQVVDPGIEQLKVQREQWVLAANLAQYLRGRVWYEAVSVKQVTPFGMITAHIEMQPGSNGQPPPLGIQEKDVNMVLFVFEHQDKEKGGKYLGQFTVTSVREKENQIELTPNPALVDDNTQLNVITASRGPWDLYEIMPVDSHQLFAQIDKDTLEKLLPAEVIAQYEHDLQPAKPSDPPADVYWWVKFTKEYAMPPGPAEAGQGAAKNPGGRPPQPVVFKPGDTHLFNSEAAKNLIDGLHVAELDTSPGKGKVFVRPLRYYATLFADEYRRRAKLVADNAEVKAQAESTEAAAAALKEDVAAAEEEKKGLGQDLAQFQVERDAVTTFVAACDKKLSTLRAELSAIFRENLKLDDELSTLQTQLLEAISRRHPPEQANAGVPGR